MFCHKCGNKSPDDAEFCQKCGAKLIVDGASPQTRSTPTPTPKPVEPARMSVDSASTTIGTQKKKSGKLLFGIVGVIVVIIIAVSLSGKNNLASVREIQSKTVAQNEPPQNQAQQNQQQEPRAAQAQTITPGTPYRANLRAGGTDRYTVTVSSTGQLTAHTESVGKLSYIPVAFSICSKVVSGSQPNYSISSFPSPFPLLRRSASPHSAH